MNEMAWGIVGAILMALINTTGSVVMLWIRARYQYHESSNGTTPPNVQSPHG